MAEHIQLKQGWYRWRCVSHCEQPVFCHINCSSQEITQTLLVKAGRLNSRIVYVGKEAYLTTVGYESQSEIETSDIQHSFKSISSAIVFFALAYRIKNVLPETQAPSLLGFTRKFFGLNHHKNIFPQLWFLYQKSYQHIPNIGLQGEFEAHSIAVPKNIDPLAGVTIVIPTRDRLDVLKPCIKSLLKTTQHLSVEILIVDNSSTCASTLRYLQQLESGYEHIRVLRWPKPFNFSAINNFAVQQSTSDFLLFLNNDIEATERGWLERMLCFARQKEVACVGALLTYPSGHIQHAGIALGVGGIAGHPLRYLDTDSEIAGQILTMPRKVAAVTAACLLIKRKLFEDVGGFDEETLAVKYNDVDLCLKLLSKGYSNVFVPDARLVHHESISRVDTLSTGAKRSSRLEENVMLKRWGRLIEADPYYPKTLSRIYEDLSLRANLQ